MANKKTQFIGRRFNQQINANNTLTGSEAWYEQGLSRFRTFMQPGPVFAGREGELAIRTLGGPEGNFITISATCRDLMISEYAKELEGYILCGANSMENRPHYSFSPKLLVIFKDGFDNLMAIFSGCAM